MKQAVAALALALGATLAAAQPGGTTPGRGGPKVPRPSPAMSSSAPSGEAAKLAWERTHRASRIIGMDVVNRQGEKVGDIEDIVLDRSGNAAYAVVSTGGFLGVGDRLHAVPWRSLEPNPGNGQFILDIDKETLGKVPGFDNTTFPDVNDPRWSAENRKHFFGNAAARSSTTGAESSPPKRKERDDARPASARSPTGSDVGPQPATSRRSGPAAGAASAGPDAGSAASSGSPTPAGDGTRRPGGTAESATGGGLTNPAGSSAGGTAPAPAGTGPGNGPSPGPLK